MIPITLVSNGAQTLAPGTSHTLSDRGDMDMCPGPLPQESISSEGSTLRVRQSGCRWTAQGGWRDLVWEITLCKLHFIYYTSTASNLSLGSYACAIPDHGNEEVIITGGHLSGDNGMKTVSVYSEAGWQRDLTPLSQGRFNHACGSYVNEGKKVKNTWWCKKHQSLIHSIVSFFWSLGEKLGAVLLTAQSSSVTTFGGPVLHYYQRQSITWA